MSPRELIRGVSKNQAILDELQQRLKLAKSPLLLHQGTDCQIGTIESERNTGRGKWSFGTDTYTHVLTRNSITVLATTTQETPLSELSIASLQNLTEQLLLSCQSKESEALDLFRHYQKSSDSLFSSRADILVVLNTLLKEKSRSTQPSWKELVKHWPRYKVFSYNAGAPLTKY